MKKAIATIDTEIGTMTLYYNGDGEAITAETVYNGEEIIETKELTPRNLDEAVNMIHASYSSGEWYLEWIDEN